RVLLDCMDPRASITLAGDTHQHVAEHSGFSSWSEFFHLLGIPGTEIETLRVSYRSARPIVDFAQELLGDLSEEADAPEATRDGPPVEFFRFGDRGACVAFLADALRQLSVDEPQASVALLTPSTKVSATYLQALERCELPRLRWVRDHDFSFSAGVEIAEIDQVKGLEFDYVILLEVGPNDFPDLPEFRRLLHVGATRAIHQLWLTSIGPPAPMLAVLGER
ncbi:MAG: 3'-5' exonuclease, partial [Myxococcota bacterium]